MWSELKYNLLEALRKGIDLAKITFLTLAVLYVVLGLGQIFFWDCFMPSCQAAADITQGKFLSFIAVILVELVFLLVISILLPIVIGIVKCSILWSDFRPSNCNGNSRNSVSHWCRRARIHLI